VALFLRAKKFSTRSFHIFWALRMEYDAENLDTMLPLKIMPFMPIG
jgi:hypothetical protein